MSARECDQRWMERAIALARNGAGMVAPNPMVGAVLAVGERILAEGWHKKVGGPHAEVECLRAYGDGPVPDDASLYVNLEPCSHHGRTPPCSGMLIDRGVKRVVIAHRDPNPAVNGTGVEQLRDAGITVVEGMCASEARWLNRRFLGSHEAHAPYVVLKWARSIDGFIDDHGRPARISSPETDVLVHRWRSEEQAIIVGSRTVINDDPLLNVRHVHGSQPLRVVLDRGNSIPASARVFGPASRTLLVTGEKRNDVSVDQVMVAPEEDALDGLFRALRSAGITSALVEGGAMLLNRFIASGRWNEARVITAESALGGGTAAPQVGVPAARTFSSGPDRIDLYVNGPAPDPSWAWC